MTITNSRPILWNCLETLEEVSEISDPRKGDSGEYLDFPSLSMQIEKKEGISKQTCGNDCSFRVISFHGTFCSNNTFCVEGLLCFCTKPNTCRSK